MVNKLKGGKADSKSLEDLARKHSVFLGTIKKELEMGMKIEKEHTKDENIAREIAMDHLAEFPDYYTRLEKMEKDGKKKAETKESMGADASGSFESPASGTILKKEIHKLKNFGSKKEVTEIVDASASGSYDAPIGHGGDPLKIDNPGKSKTGSITASKDGRAFKDKKFPKFVNEPESKFVDVKQKCKLNGLGNGKSKPCNQGDQGNLNFYESKDLKKAIYEASKKYGISVNEVQKMVTEALPGGIWDDANNKAINTWVQKEPSPKYQISTEEPIKIITRDDVELARLKVIFAKYDVKFNLEKIKD